MKRCFILLLVGLCLSQAAYAFEISKSEASEKSFIPFSKYIEKFNAESLPVINKYSDEQLEIAEKIFEEAITWAKGDITEDSELRDDEITFYEGFSPISCSFGNGFRKYFTFESDPDYEWFDKKLTSVGASKYRGIESNGATYVFKPAYDRICFFTIKGIGVTEIYCYCLYLASDGSAVTITNDDFSKFNNEFTFALASNPKNSQFAKLKLKGSEDAVVRLSLNSYIKYENNTLSFDKSYEFAIKKSDEFTLDFIPAVDGILFFKFQAIEGSVECLNIEFEAGEKLPEIKYGSENGMLVLKGVPADLGAELVSYGQVRNDESLSRPVIDDTGSYVFVAPAGYYKLRFGKNPYLDIDGEFFANNIPVSAGEATEVTIPVENLRTINELRKLFPTGNENNKSEGGSIDITAFTAKNTDGIIEMVINDKLERDVFPEAEDIKITENGVEGKVTNIERQPQPVDVVLVVDSSGSMKADMQPTIDAAKNFVKGLPDRTGIRFVQFAQKITTHKGATKEDVIKALDTVKAVGATAMYDALATALKLLEGKKKPYIVLFSDGADSREPGIDGKGSDLTKEQIIKKLEASKVTLLTIGFGKGHDPKTLKDMSSVTPNGMYVAAADKKALPSAFAAVSAKFGNQFKITYKRPYTTIDTKSDVPVIGMMIDNSRSMDMDPDENPDSDCGYRMDKVKNIFHNFIAGLPEKSLMSLMTFTGGGMSVEEIHSKQVITNDKGAVLKALSECAGIGGTPTIDALAFAISNLKSVSSSKRVLVFFTDAGLDSEFADDESMLVRYEEQLAEIKKQNIRALFAGLGGKDYIAKYKAPFEKAAKLSSGEFVITADPAEIGKKLDELIKKVDEPVTSKKNLTVSLVMDPKTEDGSRMNYSADKTCNDVKPLEKAGQVVKPGVISIKPGEKYSLKPQVKAPELVDINEKANETSVAQSIKFESKPTAHNKFAELEAQELYLLNRFKGFEPQKSIFAALKVKMTFKKADKKAAEIGYEIPSIFNHFYLSLNDCNLTAPSKLTWLTEKPLTTEPGKVNIFLDEKNSAEGFIVFDMPLRDTADGLNQLSLHVFDENNGHIELPVIGRLSKKYEEVKKLPKSEPQKLTDAFSLKIKGLEDKYELCGNTVSESDSSMFRVIDADFKSKVSVLLDIDPKERFYHALETDNGLLMSKMNNIVYSMPSGFYSKLKFAPGVSTVVRMPFVIGKELAGAPSFLWGDVARGDIKCKIAGGKPWSGKKLNKKFSHQYFDLIINDFGRYDSNKAAVDFTIIDKPDSLGTGGVDTLFSMNCKAAMPDNIGESGNHGTIIKTLTRRGLGNFGAAEFSVPGIILPDMESTRRLVYGINEQWGAFDGQSRRGIVVFKLTDNYEDSDEWELISDHIPSLKLKLTKEEFSNKALLVNDVYVEHNDEKEKAIDEAVDKAILRYAATHKNVDKTPKMGLNADDKPITTVAVPALTVYGTEKLTAVKSEKDLLELFKNLKVFFSEYQSIFYSPEAVITQGWGMERELVLIAENIFTKLGYTPVKRMVSLSEKGVEALKSRTINGYINPNHIEPIALEIRKNGKPELFVPAFGKYLSELKGLCFFKSHSCYDTDRKQIELTVSVYGKLIGEAGMGAQQAMAADIFGALGGSEDTTIEGGLKEHTTLFRRSINVTDLSTDLFDVAFSSVGKSKDGKSDLVCASVDTAAGLLIDKNLWIDTSCYELESVTVDLDGIKTTRLIASDTKLTNLHFTVGYNIPEMSSEAVKAYESAVKARAEGIKDASNYANAKWQGHAAIARFAYAYNKACKDVADKLGLKMARINLETPLSVAAIIESDGKNATIGIDLMNITNTNVDESDSEKQKAYNTVTGLLASQLEASALPGGKGQGFMHVWATMPEDANIMFIDSELREQASQYLAEQGFPKLLTDRLANTDLNLSFIVPACPGLRNGKTSWAWLEYDNEKGNLISVFDNGERSALAGYVLGLTPKNECNFMAGCLVGVTCSNFAIAGYSLETDNYAAVWNASSKLCKALAEALCATESLLSAKDVQSYMTEAVGMIGGNVTKEHTGVDFYEVYKHMKIMKGDAKYEPTFSEGFKMAVDMYFK